MPPAGLLRPPVVLLHMPHGFDLGSDVVAHVVLLYLLPVLYLRRFCLRHLQRVGRMLAPVDTP